MIPVADTVGGAPVASVASFPVLVYDTETTGFVKDREPSSHPAQPHLVQYAALMLDLLTGEEFMCANFIVKPDGWSVPKQASDVHGITTARAERYGVPLKLVLGAHLNLRAIAAATCAHNINFDRIVLEAAIHRAEVRPSSAGPAKHFCTMRSGTDVAQIKPTARMVAAGRMGFKAPNLTELHMFLFGETFEGAHDALADVRACARCLVELHKRGVIVAGTETELTPPASSLPVRAPDDPRGKGGT